MKGNSLLFPTPASELTSQYQRKCQGRDKAAPECLDSMESVETLEEALETFGALGAMETYVSDGKNKSGYFMIESGH